MVVVCWDEPVVGINKLDERSAGFPQTQITCCAYTTFFLSYISQVFRNTKFTDDMVYLMVDILTRISFLNSSPAAIILNQVIENTSFIEKEIKLRLNDININNSNFGF